MSFHQQHVPFDSLTNPIARPRLGQTGLRDPALFEHQGVIHLFCTATWWDGDRMVCTIEQRKSLDLQTWTEPTVVGVPTLCSPGNVLRVGERFVLCCQSYPITLPGTQFPTGATRHDCRLWLLWSDDLNHWSDPVIVVPGGCEEAWSPDSRRQIDPCLIEHDGRYWILCKQGDPMVGRLGLLVSDDLRTWQPVAMDRPVIGPHNLGSKNGCENPCVIRVGDEYICFLVPYEGPLCSLRSRNLRDWYGLQELNLPKRHWMQQRHNAPAVVDTRHLNGKWLMALHSDAGGTVGMSGRIGLAWSDDLINWEMS